MNIVIEINEISKIAVERKHFQQSIIFKKNQWVESPEESFIEKIIKTSKFSSIKPTYNLWENKSQADISQKFFWKMKKINTRPSSLVKHLGVRVFWAISCTQCVWSSSFLVIHLRVKTQGRITEKWKLSLWVWASWWL